MSLAAYASKTNKYTNTKELRTCFSEIKHPGAWFLERWSSLTQD